MWSPRRYHAAVFFKGALLVLGGRTYPLDDHHATMSILTNDVWRSTDGGNLIAIFNKECTPRFLLFRVNYLKLADWCLGFILRKEKKDKWGKSYCFVFHGYVGCCCFFWGGRRNSKLDYKNYSKITGSCLILVVMCQ